MEGRFDQLLHRAIESYGAGRTHPIQVMPASAGYLFTDSVEETIQQLWPQNERVEFEVVLSDIREGLRWARKGELTLAADSFASARERVAASDGFRQRTLLVNSFLEAAEGYLQYRLGHWSKAKLCVCAALEADCELECLYGFNILQIHRIQLLQNLIRAHTRSGHLDQAMDLAGQVFQYFDETIETLPVGSHWSHRRMATVPLELRLAMEAEIGCEVARALAGHDSSRALRLFRRVTFPAHSRDTQRQPRLLAWAKTKEAFLTGDTEAFLECCASFLPAGREDTPVFWYATVVDLVAKCCSCGTELSLRFREQVIRDASGWEDLPPSFEALLTTTQAAAGI